MSLKNEIFNYFKKTDVHFRDNLYYKGKDGQEYPDIESLNIADEQWKRDFYQYKSTGGDYYSDWEEALRANAVYAKSLGFKYVLMEITKNFPYLNKYMFESLLETYDGSYTNRKLLLFFIETQLNITEKTSINSEDYLNMIKLFFNRFIERFSFLKQFQHRVNNLKAKSKRETFTFENRISFEKENKRETETSKQSNSQTYEIINSDFDTVNILNGNLAKELLKIDKNEAKRQLQFFNFKYNVRVEPFIYRKYSSDRKTFDEIKVVEPDAIKLMSDVSRILSDIINKNRKR